MTLLELWIFLLLLDTSVLSDESRRTPRSFNAHNYVYRHQNGAVLYGNKVDSQEVEYPRHHSGFASPDPSTSQGFPPRLSSFESLRQLAGTSRRKKITPTPSYNYVSGTHLSHGGSYREGNPSSPIQVTQAPPLLQASPSLHNYPLFKYNESFAYSYNPNTNAYYFYYIPSPSKQEQLRNTFKNYPHYKEKTKEPSFTLFSSANFDFGHTSVESFPSNTPHRINTPATFHNQNDFLRTTTTTTTTASTTTRGFIGPQLPEGFTFKSFTAAGTPSTPPFTTNVLKEEERSGEGLISVVDLILTTTALPSIVSEATRTDTPPTVISVLPADLITETEPSTKSITDIPNSLTTPGSERVESLTTLQLEETTISSIRTTMDPREGTTTIASKIRTTFASGPRKTRAPKKTIASRTRTTLAPKSRTTVIPTRTRTTIAQRTRTTVAPRTRTTVAPRTRTTVAPRTRSTTSDSQSINIVGPTSIGKNKKTKLNPSILKSLQRNSTTINMDTEATTQKSALGQDKIVTTTSRSRLTSQVAMTTITPTLEVDISSITADSVIAQEQSTTTETFSKKFGTTTSVSPTEEVLSNKDSEGTTPGFEETTQSPFESTTTTTQNKDSDEPLITTTTHSEIEEETTTTTTVRFISKSNKSTQKTETTTSSSTTVSDTTVPHSTEETTTIDNVTTTNPSTVERFSTTSVVEMSESTKPLNQEISKTTLSPKTVVKKPKDKDSKKKDIKKKDLKKKDSKKKDVKKKNSENTDSKKKDTEKKDTEKKDTEKKDTEKKDTEKEDTEKKDTEKKETKTNIKKTEKTKKKPKQSPKVSPSKKTKESQKTPQKKSSKSTPNKKKSKGEKEETTIRSDDGFETTTLSNEQLIMNSFSNETES